MVFKLQDQITSLRSKDREEDQDWALNIHWKDPDAGKDWGQKEKGMKEDESAEWHHWLNEHEFEQTPGESGGQKSLACYSWRGYKKSDTT